MLHTKVFDGLRMKYGYARVSTDGLCLTLICFLLTIIMAMCGGALDKRDHFDHSPEHGSNKCGSTKGIEYHD